MENSTYRIKNCNCLQGCSEVKYKFFVASSRKFTEDEVEEVCEKYKPHWLYVNRELEAVTQYKQMKNLSVLEATIGVETCKKEYAHVRVRIDGSSFMKHSAGLTYTTSDKIALIGGTLGLFSGFSLLAMFEIVYWLIITIKRVFYSKAASVEPEDQQEEKIKKLELKNKKFEEEIQELKNKLLKMEDGMMMKKATDQKMLTVVDIDHAQN